MSDIRRFTIDDREPRTLHEFAICLDYAEEELADADKRLAETNSALIEARALGNKSADMTDEAMALLRKAKEELAEARASAKNPKAADGAEKHRTSDSGSDESAVAGQDDTPAMTALCELVRLKAIHDALGEPAPDDGTPEGYERRRSMQADYDANKPKAWAAARRASSQGQRS